MTNIEEIRNVLKEADARLVELHLARTKVEEAKTKAEQAINKAMRMSIALVKSGDEEPEQAAVQRPHVAGLFRSVSGPGEAAFTAQR
jgi:hypothetical protein